MLCERNEKADGVCLIVLILVLMEDALWGNLISPTYYAQCVLILVLMEDALWDWKKSAREGGHGRVLILVLMEDALWGQDEQPMFRDERS